MTHNEHVSKRIEPNFAQPAQVRGGDPGRGVVRGGEAGEAPGDQEEVRGEGPQARSRHQPGRKGGARQRNRHTRADGPQVRGQDVARQKAAQSHLPGHGLLLQGLVAGLHQQLHGDGAPVQEVRGADGVRADVRPRPRHLPPRHQAGELRAGRQARREAHRLRPLEGDQAAAEGQGGHAGVRGPPGLPARLRPVQGGRVGAGRGHVLHGARRATLRLGRLRRDPADAQGPDEEAAGGRGPLRRRPDLIQHAQGGRGRAVGAGRAVRGRVAAPHPMPLAVQKEQDRTEQDEEEEEGDGGAEEAGAQEQKSAQN